MEIDKIKKMTVNILQSKMDCCVCIVWKMRSAILYIGGRNRQGSLRVLARMRKLAAGPLSTCSSVRVK